MTIYREEGDAIEGERIICQARKYSDAHLGGATSRHGSIRLKLEGRSSEPAYCVIDKAIRWKG